MRHPLDIILEIRNTKGTNAKLEILREIDLLETYRAEFNYFTQFVNLAYNRYIRFWVKNVEIKEAGCNREWKYDDLQKANDLFCYLADRVVTGNDAIALIKSTVSKVDTKTAELIRLVLLRDFDCGLSVTSFNKVWEDLIPTYELMACHTLNEKTAKKIVGPYYVQMKYDAARVSIEVDDSGKASFLTRNGNPYLFDDDCDIVKAFSKPEFAGRMFDGEMISCEITGEMRSRKVSNGIANKLIRGTATRVEMDSMMVAVWDTYTIEEFKNGISHVPYYERFGMIKEWCNNDSFDYSGMAAENRIVETLEEAQAIGQGYIKAGYEGAIVKSSNGIWKKDRVDWCLKIKAERQADLLCVGIKAGNENGKWADGVGSLEMVSSDGLVEVSVSGISDANRELWKNDPSLVVGKVHTVLYNELIKSKAENSKYSLFLPRHVEVRFDKTEADSLEKIKEGT